MVHQYGWKQEEPDNFWRQSFMSNFNRNCGTVYGIHCLMQTRFHYENIMAEYQNSPQTVSQSLPVEFQQNLRNGSWDAWPRLTFKRNLPNRLIVDSHSHRQTGKHRLLIRHFFICKEHLKWAYEITNIVWTLCYWRPPQRRNCQFPTISDSKISGDWLQRRLRLTQGCSANRQAGR